MTDTTDPDRGFVRIPDGQIHYRTAGEASDTVPLICLHASPASSKSLIPLVQSMGHSRHVFAPDTMGNGESDPLTNADPELSDYARAMDTFCERLGFDQVDIYGNHTGAHIAVEWAIAHSDRVRRVVLDQIAILPADARADYLENYAPPREPDEMGTQFYWAWHYMRDQMLFAPHYKKSAETLHTQGVFDAATLHDLTMDLLRALKTYHLSYRAVFRQDLETRLPLVRQPVLATCSDVPDDPARAFCQTHLSDVSFAKLSGADRIASLSKAIESFLSA